MHFECGTTTDYGLTTAPQTLTGSAYRDIDADISGLAADTRYYFRVVASNAAGTVFSVLPGHFTTPTPTGPPVVTIEPATNVTASSATLHGVVDPHGLETRFHFVKINSQNATLGQTVTGNEYRDIAANWDHLPPMGKSSDSLRSTALAGQRVNSLTFIDNGRTIWTADAQRR